jgi:hypothetical protein
MLKVVQSDQVGQLSAADVPSGLLLDEIAREGARRMLAAVWVSEVLPLLYLHGLPGGDPIEPAFATVRHRTKITRGPGSKAAGLAMAFKLIMAAHNRWRAVNAPHLLALVRVGARFVNGKLVEREEDRQSGTRPVETAA